MPIWINSLGVACMGCVYGYILFFALKRHYQPQAASLLPLSETMSVLAAIGAGGSIGAAFISLEGVNYIGPYGIGLLLGLIANVAITVILQSRGWSYYFDIASQSEESDEMAVSNSPSANDKRKTSS